MQARLYLPRARPRTTPPVLFFETSTNPWYVSTSSHHRIKESWHHSSNRGTGATAIYPILLARLRPDSRIVATGGLYLNRSSIGADYCQRSMKVPTTMPRQHLRRTIYLRLQSPYWNHLHLIQSSFHYWNARASLRTGTSQYVILPFLRPHRKCCKGWN